MVSWRAARPESLASHGILATSAPTVSLTHAPVTSATCIYIHVRGCVMLMCLASQISTEGLQSLDCLSCALYAHMLALCVMSQRQRGHVVYAPIKEPSRQSASCNPPLKVPVMLAGCTNSGDTPSPGLKLAAPSLACTPPCLGLCNAARMPLRTQETSKSRLQEDASPQSRFLQTRH